MKQTECTTCVLKTEGMISKSDLLFCFLSSKKVISQHCLEDSTAYKRVISYFGGLLFWFIAPLGHVGTTIIITPRNLECSHTYHIHQYQVKTKDGFRQLCLLGYILKYEPNSDIDKTHHVPKSEYV